MQLLLSIVGALAGSLFWRAFRSVGLAALLPLLPLVGFGLAVAFC